MEFTILIMIKSYFLLVKLTTKSSFQEVFNEKKYKIIVIEFSGLKVNCLQIDES